MKTRADLLRERAALHRRIAAIDLALANLESVGHIPPTGSSATISEIVDLAVGSADLRPTRKAIGTRRLLATSPEVGDLEAARKARG